MNDLEKNSVPLTSEPRKLKLRFNLTEDYFNSVINPNENDVIFLYIPKYANAILKSGAKTFEEFKETKEYKNL